MENDIDLIVTHLLTTHPNIKIRQLKKAHEADDDGVWFISIDERIEVQLESSTYRFPFLIESNQNENRMTVRSLDEAIRTILHELKLE